MHLSSASLAAQLQTGLVQKPVAVQSARRKLATISVEWQRVAEADVRATLDEGAAFSQGAKAKRLKPVEGQDGETVIHLRDVDIVRLEVGSRPHVAAASHAAPRG